MSIIPSGMGRAFTIALFSAGGTALGFLLTILDIGDKLASPHRRYYVAVWFFAFVASIAYVGFKMATKIQGLEEQIADVANGEPRITFQSLGGPSQLNIDASGDTKRRLEVWQLWFVNDPMVRGEKAIARSLTATIEYFDGSGKSVLQFRGQWAITTMPDHVGWHDMKAEIDLGLSPVRGKLLLIGQGRGYLTSTRGEGRTGHRRDVVALAGENFHAHPTTWLHPKYRLEPEVCRVVVRLVAQNMREQEFQFKLEREQDGTIKKIAEIKP